MDAAPSLVVSTARRRNEVLVRVGGEVDFASVSRLVSALDEFVADGVKVCTIDFENVTYIDTETVKALLSLRLRFAAARKEMRLRRCSSQVRRLFTLLGVLQQIGCVDDARVP